MDCQTARHIMDGIVPDSTLSESDWEQAAIHLEECSACDHAFRSGDAFDQRISQAMHDIPVPDHLESQLLTALGLKTEGLKTECLEPEGLETKAAPAVSGNPQADTLTEDSQPSTDHPVVASETRPSSEPNWKRRGWLIGVGTAACLLVGVVALLLQKPKADPFSLAELQEQAVQLQFDDLDDFSGDFTPNNLELVTEWRFTPIQLSETPRGFHPTAPDQQVAAVYQFNVPLRNGQTEGLLVIVPKSELRDAPEEESFSIRNPTYLRLSAGNFASVSWTDGDLSYTCIVKLIPGAGDPLEQLQLVLDGEIV